MVKLCCRSTSKQTNFRFSLPKHLIRHCDKCKRGAFITLFLQLNSQEDLHVLISNRFLSRPSLTSILASKPAFEATNWRIEIPSSASGNSEYDLLKIL